MNFLIIGAGGREHAMAWKLKQSKLCDELYIAPGNAGTALCGVNLPLAVTDFEAIKKICLDKGIHVVIPGPEVPLVEGIVDFFKSDSQLQEIAVIGPGKSGAQLEGSKAFAKKFMKRHQIPTASYSEFDASNFEKGVDFIRNQSLPIVLKADGLAAGKGVLICESHEKALDEFDQMIHNEKFGEASTKVVIEEFLEGIELSVFVLTDGKDYLILPEAKDYKRIGRGDTGLNTGGMGAISPVPFADDAFMKKIEDQVIRPTIKGIQEENLDYSGFIFFGLIKVGEEPYVIEYNCRMGDPETEIVMPRLQNDLGELFNAVATHQLSKYTIKTNPLIGVSTIVVSGGYPGPYQKGLTIEVPDAEENEMIFYAGAIEKEKQVVTSGGRVMAASALAETIEEACQKSRDLAQKVRFDHKYYRNDIGWEF